MRFKLQGMRLVLFGTVAVSFFCSSCLVRQQVTRQGVLISDGYAFVTPFPKSKKLKKRTIPRSASPARPMPSAAASANTRSAPPSP